jgi:hypothetical protein
MKRVRQGCLNISHLRAGTGFVHQPSDVRISSRRHARAARLGNDPRTESGGRILISVFRHFLKSCGVIHGWDVYSGASAGRLWGRVQLSCKTNSPHYRGSDVRRERHGTPPDKRFTRHRCSPVPRAFRGHMKREALRIPLDAFRRRPGPPSRRALRLRSQRS